MQFGINFGLQTRQAGSSAYPTTGVPNVLSSVISPDQPDSIRVTWDRPMMATCDIHNQIKVIVDAHENLPTSVIFSPNKTEMSIIMATQFVADQTVTWAYDDQGTCTLQQIEVPNTEADNQTYVVDNQNSGR